ncbi:hypothetical protein BB427_13925 [Pseudoalteromonas sp. BMB]|uniref:hypothetical protein n=1 Tax=Pseudoalteromonas sp. BMB TaxID=1874619 RepID=UPI00083E48CC|nr:hypothetical protein [Pseudoalteromonas sp. BMB]ODB37091.1 hypothetical protein BB427_13925 [Pseudoalteromonas sp. BMB]
MLDMASMLLSLNGQSSSNPKVGKNNQLSGLDSPFAVLLSGSLNLNLQADTQQGADKALDGQFVPQDTLENHLQNSQTLLFTNNMSEQDHSLHFQLSNPLERAGAIASTQTAQFTGGVEFNSGTATSITQLKVTIKWGMLATGHLAQQLVSTVNYGTNEGPTHEKSALNKSAVELTNVYIGRSVVTAQFNLANKLPNNLAVNSAPSMRSHSVSAEKALLETTKPYFDSRYQPYSTQALFVFSSADKSVKVSARDYFGGQEQADELGSWLDEFVDESVVKNIKEYSFNGKVVWKREL